MAYVKNSFVALSDFHSTNDLLDKVTNYYLNEYEYIYILGDATDRGPKKDGTGGIELLNGIRTLTTLFPNRVRYIPGNHDWFLYRYALGEDYQANNLLRNGGSRTKYDIDLLKQNNPMEFNKLINWLGSQPLQLIHRFDGKTYGLAHAFFNQTLYDSYPTLCLRDEKYLSINFAEKFKDILWFRKESQEYNPADVPRGNMEVIVGHTPLVYRKNSNLDLVNNYGEKVKVHCVDGGLSYTGDMLKYDGGYGEIKTIRGEHHDTSPKIEESSNKKVENYENLFKEIVIQTIIESKSMNEACYVIYEMFRNFNKDYVTNTNNLKQRASILNSDKLQKILRNFVNENIDNPMLNQTNEFDVYSYIVYTSLDYIYFCLLAKYGTIEHAQNNLTAYLNSGSDSYITKSQGNARTVAQKVGLENLKSVSLNHINKLISELEKENKFKI